MRIVVSDTTCMIDLRKVALLEAFLRLPYTVVMPDTFYGPTGCRDTSFPRCHCSERGIG